MESSHLFGTIEETFAVEPTANKCERIPFAHGAACPHSVKSGDSKTPQIAADSSD